MGILPGTEHASANPWIDIAVPTGLGEVRNAIVARAAHAVVALGGEYGTLLGDRSRSQGRNAGGGAADLASAAR